MHGLVQMPAAQTWPSTLQSLSALQTVPILVGESQAASSAVNETSNVSRRISCVFIPCDVRSQSRNFSAPPSDNHQRSDEHEHLLSEASPRRSPSGRSARRV